MDTSQKRELPTSNYKTAGAEHTTVVISSHLQWLVFVLVNSSKVRNQFLSQALNKKLWI
jgi:hypothetical protein